MVWKKASEQLPEQSVEVIIVTDCGYVTNTSYSDRHKLFNTHDRDSEEEAHKYAIPALYWAYPADILPEGCNV